jgi:uncharacterized protein (DUF433 family)
MSTPWNEYISTDINVLGGKPVIKGTRIGVDLIFEKLGSGDSIDDLLTAYPHLTREAILACITFASYSIRNEMVLDMA